MAWLKVRVLNAPLISKCYFERRPHLLNWGICAHAIDISPCRSQWGGRNYQHRTLRVFRRNPAHSDAGRQMHAQGSKDAARYPKSTSWHRDEQRLDAPVSRISTLGEGSVDSTHSI